MIAVILLLVVAITQIALVTWYRVSRSTLAMWIAIVFPVTVSIIVAIFAYCFWDKSVVVANVNVQTVPSPAATTSPVVATTTEVYERSSAQMYDDGYQQGNQVATSVVEELRQEIRQGRPTITAEDGTTFQAVPDDGYSLAPHGNGRWTLTFSIGKGASPKRIINTELVIKHKEAYYIYTEGVIPNFRVGIKEANGCLKASKASPRDFANPRQPFRIYRQSPADGEILISTQAVPPGNYTVHIEKSAALLEPDEYAPGVKIGYLR